MVVVWWWCGGMVVCAAESGGRWWSLFDLEVSPCPNAEVGGGRIEANAVRLWDRLSGHESRGVEELD